MVGRSYSLNMNRFEATDLRIALYETKEDVKRLQEEIEAEREAADSSASEAMSMILRLQGEKATLAMEARQYKRIVEERMFDAEMNLELLEDLYYCKEVEIKNLECELDAYRSKLMCLKCRGIDVRSCDRSQTPSPEDIDFLVPMEKEVVIEKILDSSTRDHEKFDEQLKETVSIRDEFKTLKQETVSVSETKNEAFSAISSNIKYIAAKEKAKGMCKPDMLVKKKSSKQKRERCAKRDHRRGSCSANDAEYQTELQRLKERIDRLVRERCNTEPQTSEVKKEIMILQRKPEEELSSLQSEMKTLRTTLSSDDSAIVAVQEAMLYFWL